MKLADKMRVMTNKAAYDKDSPSIQNAYKIIVARITKQAEAGKHELVYPFDDIAPDGTLGGFHRLDDNQIKVLVGMFEREGFKYHYSATQDPGHPCDRELHVLRW